MDARTRYTKMAIRNSFFELLKKYPLEKITVTAICDIAEINRTTFYKYYENPYDLLSKIEAEVLDELHSKIASMEKTRLSPIFLIVLEDLINRKDMYLILFSKNVDMMFKKRLFEMCYADNIENIKLDYPRLDEQKQSWLYYFIAEGCTGVVSQWIKNDMAEPPEEVAAFLEKLVYSVDREIFQFT